MNYPERELLKEIARAVALLAQQAPSGGAYAKKMLYEKIDMLEAREELEARER